MGITPTMIAGGLGAIGSLSGLFGGHGASSVQLPPQQFNYAPQTTGAIGSLAGYNLGANYTGDIGGIAQGYLNNPYAGGYQGGANYFSPFGQSNALSALANSGLLGGTVGTQIGAGNTILNAGFDPQNALYGRTAQQVSDQSLAGLANSGLATTPWGQGVYGNTMSNFNIDWQNNLLNRMTQAGGAATGLYGGAGNQAAGAFGLGNAGYRGGIEAAGMPWGVQNAILGGMAQGPGLAANFGNTISQIPGQQASDWLSLTQGINNTNIGQASLGLQQQQQGFNQNQIYGRNLGSSLGLMFGGSGGGFTGAGFNNAMLNSGLVNPLAYTGGAGLPYG